MKEFSSSLIKAAIVAAIILFVLLGIFLSYYYVIPALAGTLRYLIPVLLPFILAYVLAELINPSVSYLVKRYKLDRGFTVLLVLIVFFGSFLAGMVWIISRLIIELIDLSKYLPALSNEIKGYILEIFNRVSDYYYSLGLNYDVSQQLVNNVAANAEKLINQLTSIIGQLLTSSIYLFSLVPEVVLVMIFTLLATFFIARDREKIIKKITDILPTRLGNILESTNQEIGIALVGFIRAQLVLMLITFLQTLLGLHFLGYEFALIIALLVSFVDALPVLGPGAVFVPWIIREIVSKNIRNALGLVILYIFITAARQILQPKIVSVNVGIHPLEAILAIYIGLKVFGVLGVFIGPILLVIIKAFVRGWKKHSKE